MLGSVDYDEKIKNQHAYKVKCSQYVERCFNEIV